MMPPPSADNDYLVEHARLLLGSHRHWTGHDLLLDPSLPAAAAAQALYEAPFALLSHDTATDPVFTYANLTAQRLFAMPWQEIVGLPSRLSAEPLAREERERLLAQVATHGYIDDYSGIRIASTGQRFRIASATVWNLLDDSGNHCGQAACFADWQPL
jgi:hypothetical protein